MRGAISSLLHALVVNLGGGDALVAEESLDVEDIDAGFQQQRCRCRTEGVRRVDAAFLRRPIVPFDPFNRTWQAPEIAENELVQGREPDRSVPQFVASRVESGAKERPRRDPGVLKVLLKRFGELGVDTDRPPRFAATLLPNPDRRVLVFHVEVFDEELRAGGDPRTGEEIELQDGPVSVVEDALAARESHELSGVSR